MRNFFIILILISSSAFSQNDSTEFNVALKGYVESYYCWDAGDPINHTRPGFIYSYNRHNEVNVNLGYISGAFTSEKARANFALMGGTYSNANLASEPGVLRNIYEANAGIKLLRKHNLWFDMGVFPSHVGFESANGHYCYTLTRSICADNSPYFESGAKLTYTSKHQKWLLSALVLNGWQRIQRLNGNNTPCFGSQITWNPDQRISLNSSTFIGNDKPDSVKQMRYFHDLYGIFKLHSKLSAIVGFDIGAQQVHRDTSKYNVWYAPILVLEYKLTKKAELNARAEYYFDDKGVIIYTGTKNGFQTTGYSLNFDYYVYQNVLWRIEARGFNSKDKIFTMDKKPSNQNYFFTTSLAITF